MINFRDVRSYSDLERFLAAFQRLDSAGQDLILTEMVGLISAYRQNESQSDLFKDQGLEKKEPTSRKRRPRRSKA